MPTAKATLLTLIMACALSISTSKAQESNSKALQPGSRALQFQITDDFSLDSFSGTLISYKYQKTNTLATRIGVSLNGQVIGIDVSNSADETSDITWNVNLGMSYTWLHYINPDAEIKFYYGYGPGVTIGYQKSETEVENTNGNPRNITLKTKFIGLAGLGYAGVEWFFTESMSLHAEYSAAIRFTFRGTERTGVSNAGAEKNSTLLELGGEGVRFGISVYF